MQAVYPVLFTKTKECILVEAPDLEVLTEGRDMKNAIEMARDAMELMCVTLEDHKKEIPEPSDTLDIAKGTFSGDGETILSYVDIDSGEYRRKIDTKAVRKNVTIPSWRCLAYNGIYKSYCGEPCDWGWLYIDKNAM